MKKLLTLFTLLLTTVSGAWATDETPGNTGESSTAVSGTSYTIAGTYVAGKGGKQTSPMESKGVKVRLTASGTNNSLTITVNDGYIINDLTIYAVTNTDNASCTVTSVKVDGENAGSAPYTIAAKNASTASTIALTDIDATESIVLSFGNVGGSGEATQAHFDFHFSYSEAPTTPTLTGAWKIGEETVTSANVVQGASVPTMPTFTVGATSGSPTADDYDVAYSLKEGSTAGIFTFTDGVPTAISTATAGSATIVATLTTADNTKYLTPTTNTFEYTLTVSPAHVPVISVDGAGNVARGGSLTLTATVTEAVPDITYIKWYACDSEGTISGDALGTELTYTPSTTTVGTYYYRAVVNNGVGGDANHDVYSDVQTVNVLPQAPTFTPAAGAIFAGNTVTLASADDGTIYYTTDGSEPTAVIENFYSEPITVNEAMTIKAIAVKSGLSSTTATAAYTIKDVATPVISKRGLVVSGTQVTITSSDGNAATIYYTLDGSDPKTSDTKQTYSSPISITSSCTLNAVAKVNSTFSKSASASFTIGNANQYSYVYGTTKTSPSGASFTVPEAENPTTVEIIYYTSSSTWTDNKNATPAYFQGNGNPTYTDGIPTGGAYMKLTPSNDGTITFIGYSGGTKTYYVKKADGTQLKTGKTPSSAGLYEINFDVEKNVVYYVYVDGSKIMFNGLTFTSKFNSIDVKIGVNGWTSYISNQNLDFGNATPSGLTAYAAIYGEENITLNNVTEVPANKGLVLSGTANTTYTVPVLASTEASVTTDLKGNATADYAVNQNEYNYYVLANVGGEEGFYEYTGTAAIPAGKAFFEVAAGGAKFLPIIISEDETDGIKSVQGSRFTVNGEAYNLAGQRVGKDYKGIVIVNGKKVIRK